MSIAGKVAQVHDSITKAKDTYIQFHEMYYGSIVPENNRESYSQLAQYLQPTVQQPAPQQMNQSQFGAQSLFNKPPDAKPAFSLNTKPAAAVPTLNTSLFGNTLGGVGMKRSQILNSACFPNYNVSNPPTSTGDIISVYKSNIPSICSGNCAKAVNYFHSAVLFACSSTPLFQNSNVTAEDFSTINLIATAASCVQDDNNNYCIIDQLNMAGAFGVDMSQPFGVGAGVVQKAIATGSLKQGLVCSTCVKSQLAAISNLDGATGTFQDAVVQLNNTYNSNCTASNLQKEAGSYGDRAVLSFGAIVIALAIII
ncbi:hypothetical protein HDV01_003159 [Terramyces sp. JEL0728]|nr:hypothetical protein HDV01_003159 [Terramyces sp. JEL0728]